MFWVKLRAGALQLTLFIIVVIALLLTAFILLINTHKRFQIQTDFIIETTRNADKGIDYALQNTIRLNDTTSINLEDEDYKTLKVYRDFWGVFEKLTTVSQIKNNRFQKIALIGAKQSIGNRTALYIQDNNKPLVLVGNTKIEGAAYLPKQGVKSGTISGQSYNGSQLIYGQTRLSSNNLPKVFSETIDQIKSIENKVSEISQNQFLDIENRKKQNNSFSKPVQIIFSNNTIELRNIKLTGHLIIQSKSKIIVYSTSNLKDVVLIAPEIEIKSNVSGNFQAIASKKITVGNNVKLNYPSALILNEKQEILQETLSQTSEQNNIIINDNSIVEGSVVYIGQEKLNNYNIQIEIKEKAIIIGELYCTQNLELKGTVYGSVFTNNFIANQSGSVYQNHIYNGTIIVNELPKEYVGLPFNNSKKEILKWLY